MRLENYPIEKLKKEILTVLGLHLDLANYQVFFFGSRVQGRGSDRSDIDVGLDGPSIALVTMGTIKDMLNALPMLYKIDIVDFSSVTPEFRAVAMQDIEVIHESQYAKSR